MALTIPELFDAAVAEVPDKAWLVYEDEAFTYAAGPPRSAAPRRALAELGVGRGDLVLATARSRPEYVFAWLAAMYLGAIYVPANPRNTEAELAGLAGQVEPGADRDRRELPRRCEPPSRLRLADVDELLAQGAKTCPDPGRRGGRPGRADPHLGHDRPLEARDADAPRAT